MSVADIISYDKDGKVERFPLFRKLFLAITIILVASLAFGLGRLSVIGKREPIKIEYDQTLNENQPKQVTQTSSPTGLTASVINTTSKLNSSNSNQEESTVVASKNGVRYHYLHCSGVKQIKEENKIVFSSPQMAEEAGYTLAANCKPK